MTHLQRTNSHDAVNNTEQVYNELCMIMVIIEGNMHIYIP